MLTFGTSAVAHRVDGTIVAFVLATYDVDRRIRARRGVGRHAA